MRATEAPEVDCTVTNEGSLFLFQPCTQAAREWIEEHVVGETTYFGTALAVEHRYAWSLAQGMVADGLKLQ